jgi:hypothetical protein
MRIKNATKNSNSGAKPSSEIAGFLRLIGYRKVMAVNPDNVSLRTSTTGGHRTPPPVKLTSTIGRLGSMVSLAALAILGLLILLKPG